MKYCILVDGEVVETTFLKWMQWFENTENRLVAETFIDGVRVSTVFLGINHQSHPGAPPLWFKTMIFGGGRDGFMHCYTDLEEAVRGHESTVHMVRGV